MFYAFFSDGNRSDSSNSNSRSSTSQHRGSKSRWLNNKNGDSQIHHRKEEYRARQLIGNGYEQNSKESSGKIHIFIFLHIFLIEFSFIFFFRLYIVKCIIPCINKRTLYIFFAISI